ncbi:MAG: MtrB/PioB family outer membrane beta-barrel protein, partial [Syntrophobacteraceae bacterium]|nr:MtrB/PioB family outer membrane beta-barrel protein [Syntrophobacteraceae bacterium]
IESQMRRAFIRFKTPDFPFHLFADVQTLDRKGLVQQRFLRGDFSAMDKVSRSRSVDWETQDVRLGMNSHLGPLEAEYSHEEKKFQVNSAAVLFDTYPWSAVPLPHNQVPDLKSSQDTVKLHTSYSGGVVAGVTFSNGDKKNQDSGSRVEFQNAAADITYMPVSGLTVFVKYRHYDLDTNSPDTVLMPGLGTTYTVRDSLSSTRDQVSGIVRYRVNTKLTIKAEYQFETISRGPTSGDILSLPSGTTPNYWDIAHRTTKNTEKIGITYRIMNKLSLRADIRATQVTDPAYANDPDRIYSGTATVTWTPVQRLIALASYSGVQEQRSDLAAPLDGGSMKSDFDQALASLTFLVGKRSSVTASYLYFKNDQSQTLTFHDGTGASILENGVPYGDKAQAFSLSASVALSDGIMVTADGSKCYTKGNFRLNGTVPNSDGIDVLSDMKIVEDIYGASIAVEHTRRLSSELRYQQRKYDDEIDNTQDGKVSTMLAFLSMKW